jgi:2,3-bisphosphoglycerate-dependent phosphoglycerate mutase
MKKRPALRIYLFRHGQTEYNKKKVHTGWSDSLLTKEGKRNARTIANKLKSKKIEIAFQTDLTRSIDTLTPLLKDHPECILVIQDKRMRERNYGDLNDKSHEWAKKKYGEAQWEKWHRGFKDRPPKGESFADVQVRVKSFIKDLVLFMKKYNVNVAISAHGNSIRLFRKIMENSSIDETCSWVIPYDQYYEYSI